MNGESNRERAALPYVIAVLGSFLIVAALGWAIHRYTQPAPLGEDRAATRAKALAELRAGEQEAIDHFGWVDQSKGIVRLPVGVAVDMVLREWQNPAAARSNLIARVEKATAPPPKAPEKPSIFE